MPIQRPKGYQFYEQFIIFEEDLGLMIEAYCALTTSSTFPPSTPKITFMNLKWYNT